VRVVAARAAGRVRVSGFFRISLAMGPWRGKGV
jgi:hypothetical protein